MRTFLTTIALLATAMPVPLLAQTTAQRFTRDGVTYVYTVTSRGDRQVIQGRRLPSGSAFRLVVSGDRVDGVSGGQPVSFRTPAAATTLAAR